MPASQSSPNQIRVLTPALIEAAIALRQECLSIKEISNRLHLHHSTRKVLNETLVKAGLPRNVGAHNRIPLSLHNEIRTFAEFGISLDEIKQTYDYPLEYIKAVIEGKTEIPQATPAPPKPPKPPPRRPSPFELDLVARALDAGWTEHPIHKGKTLKEK